MKRFTAVLLTALLLLSALLSGCGMFVDSETKGAYINVYMGSELRVWDPAAALTDASAVQYLSLCYESMMQYDTAAMIAYILGLKQPQSWIGRPVKTVFK